jgi:glycerol-3-phosphate acyltransferase PlsY
MDEMNTFTLILVLFSSYLIGSISFARIVTKIWSGKDVTDFEVPIEGEAETTKVVSIGANAVSSELGVMAGMLVSILDILKITLVVILTRRFLPDNTWAQVLAAAGGMIGHNWPIYHRFHGGAGYSTIMGALIIFDPLAVLVTPLIGVFLGVVVFRNYLIATVGWMWLLIPWFWLRKPGQIEFIFYAFAVNIIFILAMIPEVKMALKSKQYVSSNRLSTPMGRGYMKMARALGFKFDDQQEDEKTADSSK